MLKKTRLFSSVLSLLMISAVVCCTAAAEDTGTLLAKVQGTQAVCYLLDADAGQEITCQIGSAQAAVSQKTNLSDLKQIPETVLIFDNSLSIQKQDRETVKEIADCIIENRLGGEVFTVATVAGEVSYLCEEQPDGEAVKTVVDEIEYKDQETQLTDGLYNVLLHLKEKDSSVLRRIILFSDGVDNKTIGYTKDELNLLIQELGYPVYTIGCTNPSADGDEKLENLFAIARVSQGDSVYLKTAQEDAAQIAALTSAWNDSAQVVVELPAEMCDGLQKAIRLTAGEKVYQTTITTPLGETAAQTAEEQPEPETTDAGSEGIGSRTILLAAVGVGGVVLVAVIVFLVLQKKKKKAEWERLPSEKVPREPSDTEVNSKTEYVPDAADSKTLGVWERNAQSIAPRLRLTDTAQPSRSYEVSLEEAVTVGRSAENRIRIDYNKTVSGLQCVLRYEGGRLYVKNKSETNITKLDGVKLGSSDTEALPGSVLTMGRVEMKIDVV